MQDKARELIASVKNLPPVSQTALRLTSLLSEPAVANEDIVQVLRHDNVLTAKLLRACNSAYFGLEEPVYSVEQAILLLGHQQTLHIVLTLAFAGAMVPPLPSYVEEAAMLRRHSVLSATAAEILSGEDLTVTALPSVAFTASLLHDIGRLVMCQALPPAQWAAVGARRTDGCGRLEAERAALGTDHAALGATLLELWRLPGEIAEAVANHHQPVCAPKPRLSALVHVTDALAHAIESPDQWASPDTAVSEAVLDGLGLSRPRLEELIPLVRERTEQSEEFLKLA